jgi:chemotaxis protein methyltransferase CheR
MRVHLPEGLFHLILCRNLVLIYFEETLQRAVIQGVLERLMPGGFFVVGIHEALPPEVQNVIPYDRMPGVYQKKML